MTGGWEDGEMDADGVNSADDRPERNRADDTPELNGADDRPLYSPRRKRLLRAVVFLGLGLMLFPILANLYTITVATASDACARAVAYARPDATGASARFEIFGAGGLGWECYSVGGFGPDEHIASLGLIPGEVQVPSGTRT